MLLHAASCCFTLPHAAPCCLTLPHAASRRLMLPHAAPCCLTLPHAASRCLTRPMLPHVASYCIKTRSNPGTMQACALPHAAHAASCCLILYQHQVKTRSKPCTMQAYGTSGLLAFPHSSCCFMRHLIVTRYCIAHALSCTSSVSYIMVWSCSYMLLGICGIQWHIFCDHLFIYRCQHHVTWQAFS